MSVKSSGCRPQFSIDLNELKIAIRVEAHDLICLNEAPEAVAIGAVDGHPVGIFDEGRCQFTIMCEHRAEPGEHLVILEARQRARIIPRAHEERLRVDDRLEGPLVAHPHLRRVPHALLLQLEEMRL